MFFIFRKGVRYYEILSILRRRTCKFSSILLYGMREIVIPCDTGGCSGCRNARGEEKRSKKHVKKRRYSEKKKRPVAPAKASEVSDPVREDDYDGYYDDVRPFDEGGGREEIDKTLVKKIILVVACVLLIAGVCVALMYLI